MRTHEIRRCNVSQYLKNTASCNCKHKQKQRQRKPKASENKRYTQANKKANTKETKEKRTKPKANKHKQNKDKSKKKQANIQAKRRTRKKKQLQAPVKIYKNNAKASKHKQTRAKTIKGTDMLALIQINTQDAKVHVLTSYERSFYMRQNSKPLFASATTITKNEVELASMKFQFEIKNMQNFAHRIS